MMACLLAEMKAMQDKREADQEKMAARLEAKIDANHLRISPAKNGRYPRWTPG
jgi:hypothetical protein